MQQELARLQALEADPIFGEEEMAVLYLQLLVAGRTRGATLEQHLRCQIRVQQCRVGASSRRWVSPAVFAGFLLHEMEALTLHTLC